MEKVWDDAKPTLPLNVPAWTTTFAPGSSATGISSCQCMMKWGLAILLLAGRLSLGFGKMICESVREKQKRRGGKRGRGREGEVKREGKQRGIARGRDEEREKSEGKWRRRGIEVIMFARVVLSLMRCLRCRLAVTGGLGDAHLCYARRVRTDCASSALTRSGRASWGWACPC